MILNVYHVHVYYYKIKSRHVSNEGPRHTFSVNALHSHPSPDSYSTFNALFRTYQAYLAKIQTENMASLHSFSSTDDDDSELDSALNSIHHVRENVRYSYAYNEEEQNTATNTVADSCYDNEGRGATQLGGANGSGGRRIRPLWHSTSTAPTRTCRSPSVSTQ